MKIIGLMTSLFFAPCAAVAEEICLTPDSPNPYQIDVTSLGKIESMNVTTDGGFVCEAEKLDDGMISIGWSAGLNRSSCSIDLITTKGKYNYYLSTDWPETIYKDQ